MLERVKAAQKATKELKQHQQQHHEDVERPYFHISEEQVFEENKRKCSEQFSL